MIAQTSQCLCLSLFASVFNLCRTGMILYSKRFYGLALMFQMFGSALPRALPFAVFGGAIAFLLRFRFGDYLEENWRHPFPYQAIAFIAGFLVTFRCVGCVCVEMYCTRAQ